MKKLDKLVVASNNKGKIKEIKNILSKLPLDVVSLEDMGVKSSVEEDGETFEENAFKKALEIYKILGSKHMVLADDSGLMVDVLNGAPGVYSARFAGEHGNDKKNNEKLLKMLESKENRKAKFVCSMVLIYRNKVIKVNGEVEGNIIKETRGANGFGYDPLFYIPEYNMTFAEMDSSIKNNISHRAKALNKILKEITKLIQGEK
ncbi:Non-canonical purine NTP pyrophosphatase [Clostridium acetireducens DSM 10703]|uniref:dITP/XTP pyrophosphatase n=1 Tax=Clostridium acetireducens DSM 10703 TaxID=1121290 RepID=A0A1E8EZV0_9CLOT|nr:XTP/dITP diphosphatase [Clostridium acetireducens]OFI06251.1 Non-canonical purine NTP pyrophosphatase [Clostridium acetireducens DSM 10703]